MKLKRFVITLTLAVSFNSAAFADTYAWMDNNGRRVYSDRQPIGVSYKVTRHGQPENARAVSTSITAQPVGYLTTSSVADTESRQPRIFAADAASAIQERDRSMARECLAIKFTMERLSSSRNFTIDPETGRSLEERLMKESRDRYSALC